ncbi:MAG: hypothetical protein IT449_10405 [Phycisphaerales bacterium]|nr:hypothetical protein [Phycisphaerales bacterium]
MRQSAVADDGEHARPAVSLLIEGPSQEINRWLVADDPARNKLTSFIAMWRYMGVADRAARDELFKQFTEELTREPRLGIRGLPDGGMHEFPLRTGEVQTLQEPNCRFTVREFFPHFALEAGTSTPINQSSKNVNPAARVAIEKDGRSIDVWVFARHPDRGARAANELGLELRLDCPADDQAKRPDYVIVTIAGGDHEAWSRVDGRVNSAPIKPDEKVVIPGSKYTFRLAQYLAKARLVEDWLPGGGAEATPVLCVEVGDGETAPTPAWLPLNKPGRIPLTSRTLTLTFTSQSLAAQGAHP